MRKKKKTEKIRYLMVVILKYNFNINVLYDIFF